MNSSRDYIVQQLSELYKTFNGIKIRYEYRDYLATHLIEILPLDLFENNHDFILKEMQIQDEFEKLYGSTEEILFISSDSLNMIREEQNSWGHGSIEITQATSILFNHLFGSPLENKISDDNTSYALAA